MPNPIAQAVFGARGQLIVGSAACSAAVGAWVYGVTLHGDALLRFLFHVSMGFGLVACYALVGTALGYRATERVEQKIDVDIEGPS